MVPESSFDWNIGQLRDIKKHFGVQIHWTFSVHKAVV